MRRTPFLLVAVTAALIAPVARAQTVKSVPMARTPVSDGAAMFNSYCASCHGRDGTGHGPAAGALAKAPADLTKLSARNQGAFPGTKVRRYIEGADEVAAHGSRDMPVWGALFREMEAGTAPLRIEALTNFLKSIQK